MELRELFDRDDTSASAFICRCTQEGAAEADRLMAEVRARLAEDFTVDDRTFLSVVVHSLNWDYDAGIKDIACDQWAMVRAGSYDGKYSVSVQCDEVEDGIAAVWYAFASRAQRLSGNQADDGPWVQRKP